MKTIELAIPVEKALSVKDVESLASRQNGGAECVVTKRSLDARGGIVYRYQIEVYASGEHPEPYEVPEYRDVRDSEPVIVVGAGPAGMFAALRLLSLGLKPIILERGKDVHARKTDMAKLSREGVIDPDSNYCYGEGGAGAFSDGKLFTRSSKRGDIRLVLHQLVRFGASPDILIDAHPHIGSDKLPLIVENIRKCIIEHGGEYHFNSRVVDISGADVGRCPQNCATLGNVGGETLDGINAGLVELDCNIADSGPVRQNCATLGDIRGGTMNEVNGGVGAADVLRTASGTGNRKYKILTDKGETYTASKVILATGHSARDIYELLDSKGVTLEAKGFALGVRVEHPQETINRARYHGRTWKGMPAAEYSFVEQVDGRGVFSFCMCPGGILVPSSTEEGTVVLNGMSNSARNSRWANAGVVVQIEPGDAPEKYKSDGAFSLLNYQRDIERSMAQHTSHPLAAPAQRMTDFCKGRISSDLPESSYFPGTVPAPLHMMLPQGVSSRLKKAFPLVDKKIHGYYSNDALLLGVESRTSSPVRIPRNPDTLQTESMPGLYPCGEGAGYSGGIVSSAIDGIRCAEAAAEKI